MFPRPSFWLGLLLGASPAFVLCRRWLPAPGKRSPDPLLDLVGDAVVVCDASSTVTYANTAARSLFGPNGRDSFELCYPSGQRVPPGQVPITRALRSRKSVEGAGYVCAARVLNVSARPIAGGGAAAVFRDVTAIREAQAREGETEKQERVLSELCHRLGGASDAADLGQAVVESALALLDGLPDMRARLYLYDAERGQLTRQASVPEEMPKRPRSHRQAQPPTFPFDAKTPLLWQVYIARQPFVSADVASDDRFLIVPLSEEKVGSAIALPLLAEGAALGHLSLTCPVIGAFAGRWLAALELLTALAASALAGQRQAAQSASLSEQMTALCEIAQAVANFQEANALADLVAGQVQRIIEAEVCTLTVKVGDSLRLVGEVYKDALLFPEKHNANDPALLRPKTRMGNPNPAFEDGPWRAFAGQSGTHSVLSVPLAAGQGALTVYAAGDAPFFDAQIKFLDTVAGLLSAAFRPAMMPAERES